jgi:DUF4097 and DUF4098 domain-containing protein YvlB
VLLASLAVLSLAVAPASDTTFTVQRGERLELSVQNGDITVRAWNRNAVEVRTSTSGETSVRRRGGVIELDTDTRRPSDDVDYESTVPAWMDLTLEGMNTDIRVTGSDAAISAQTVEGDIDVTGGSGVVTLQSVDGSVSLTHSKGKITLGSVNSDVTVDGATGQLSVETVNGEIKLRNVDSDDVDVSTVNGDVTYDGPIRTRGRYHFVTHNGDVTMSIQEGADAVVGVSTYSGDFESEFPVTTRGTQQKRFTFTLGSGSARIELETFQGTIHLVRPTGAAGTRTRR